MLNNIVKFPLQNIWGKKSYSIFFKYYAQIMEIYVCSIVENIFFVILRSMSNQKMPNGEY